MKEPKDMTDRELDEAVAREVFGAVLRLPESRSKAGDEAWMVKSVETGNWVYLSCAMPNIIWGPDQNWNGGPRFCTSMNAAWAVVKAMIQRGYGYDIDGTVPESGIVFTFHKGDDAWGVDHVDLARAICLAALAALSAVRAKEKVQ